MAASAEVIIAIVITLEVLVIAVLVFMIYRRKNALAAEVANEANTTREGLLYTDDAADDKYDRVEQGGVPTVEEEERSYPLVIMVTIGVFSGYASLVLLQHHTMGVMETNYVSTDAVCTMNVTSTVQCSLTDGSDGICSKGSCKMTQDATDSFETIFKHAASFNYIFNLIFRLAHNFVFACVIPRYRVYLALGAMFSSMGSICIFIYMLKGTSVGWIFFSYAVGGIAVGTFESNLLSSIKPLGHGTKVWAIIGMPVG